MTDIDLLWRWLEDPAGLADDELARLHAALAADPALAARARRHLQLAANLGALAAPAPPRHRVRRRYRPTPPRRALWLALAAILIAALALPLVRGREPVIGRLGDGHELRVGDRVETAAAPAELRLLTGDIVRLEPGCTLRIVGASGHAVRLELASGALAAEVVPRATPGFAITTPRATATVLGTRFHLRSDAAGDELAVERGRVAWESPAGRIEVEAGRSATVRAGEAPTLRPRGRRWSFDDRVLPAAIVAGTIVDDAGRGPCLRGVPYHEPTNSLGMLASDPAGLTRIGADRSLSFRYRIEQGDGVTLSVWAQTADGAQWRLRREPDLSPGWHEQTVNLSELGELDDPARHPAEGALVVHLTIGVNNGRDRVILLDDIEMSEP